jgi:hypothetical protein
MFTHLLSHEVKWLHILAAAAAYWILGALWYSPLLFSKPWAKSVGINMNDPNAKKGMGASMVASFVLMFITSIGLAVIYKIIKIHDAVHALEFGLFFGVVFSLTAISISFVYEKKPLALYLIDGFYHVAGLIVASLVLVLWH